MANSYALLSITIQRQHVILAHTHTFLLTHICTLIIVICAKKGTKIGRAVQIQKQYVIILILKRIAISYIMEIRFCSIR